MHAGYPSGGATVLDEEGLSGDDRAFMSAIPEEIDIDVFNIYAECGSHAPVIGSAYPQTPDTFFFQPDSPRWRASE